MILNWNATKEEHELIVKIAERAKGILERASRLGISQRDLIMDLTACHANGNPLDLAGLLEADDINFSHDVCGILGKLDRKTGKLMDCFTPRYSAPRP